MTTGSTDSTNEAETTELEQADDQNEATDEQVEPLDLSPLERKLVTQPYDLGVKGLKSDIDRGRLKLSIEYQRRYVWDQGKASRLIESLLLNVPIPVCYFSEDDNGDYEVIDGLQRLTAIFKFIDEDLTLTGLSVLNELNGKTFAQLAPRDQRRLENRTIRCIVITEESHPDIKFDVFERLNTGAVSLTAQELRNSIYRGSFNDGLKELSKQEFFVSILGNHHNRRMDFEELILRFFALYDGLPTYKPPLRQFLNTYMRSKRRSEPSPDMVAIFEDTCQTIHAVFGATAFRLPGSHNPVNKALFDSLAIPIAFADRAALRANPDAVIRARDELLQDEEFKADIGRATADRQRMWGRVRKFGKSLTDLGISVNLPPMAE